MSSTELLVAVWMLSADVWLPVRARVGLFSFVWLGSRLLVLLAGLGGPSFLCVLSDVDY